MSTGREGQVTLGLVLCQDKRHDIEFAIVFRDDKLGGIQENTAVALILLQIFYLQCK
jgi:hypothetical protein